MTPPHTEGMKELIEKLEKADRPSRELDCGIARMSGWHRVEPRFCRGKHGGWISPADFLGVESSGAPRLDSLHGTTIQRDPPNFTSSIDAALTLVPEGWDFCISGGGNQYEAGIAPKNQVAAIQADAALPALALCIAALRARASQ